MHKVLSWCRGGLFAVGTVVALGFGGAQALASPSTSGGAARACFNVKCNADCQASGAVKGYCEDGYCKCIFFE